LIEYLRQSPLFHGLSRGALAKICSCLLMMKCQKKDEIMKERVNCFMDCHKKEIIEEEEYPEEVTK